MEKLLDSQPDTKVKDVEKDQPAEPAEPTPQWRFVSDEHSTNEADGLPESSDTAPDSKLKRAVKWTGPEFITHKKSFGWYLLFGASALVLALLVFFISHHDKESTAVIVFAALILGVYSIRKPKDLEYKLDDSGVHIGAKFYGYGSFKSFSIHHDGSSSSIALMPLKRFMPELSLYYPPEDESKIKNALTEKLPFELPRSDFIDTIIRLIHY